MTLTLYPYKLIPGELEARLEGGLAVLPGQWLRFEGERPVYGRVVAIRTMPSDQTDDAKAHLVRLKLFHGSPTLAPQSVTLLNDAQLLSDVQALLAAPEHPLRIGNALTCEFFNLGALTIVTGDDFLAKYEALMTLLRGLEPYQRVLVLDPLGVLAANDRMACLRAGTDVRLSLQAVGAKRFLEAFGELFPDSLRELGLRTLVSLLPANREFIGFQSLFALEALSEAPLRNLILQHCQALEQVQLFANTPEQVMTLQRLLSKPINAIDLSHLEGPWKRLFYEALCHAVFRHAGGDVALVLIYPEHYLNDLPVWIQKAEEAEINLTILASPYLPETIQSLANNVLTAEFNTQAGLCGDLTLNIPVRFALESASPALAERERSENLPDSVSPHVSSVPAYASYGEAPSAPNAGWVETSPTSTRPSAPPPVSMANEAPPIPLPPSEMPPSSQPASTARQESGQAPSTITPVATPEGAWLGPQARHAPVEELEHASEPVVAAEPVAEAAPLPATQAMPNARYSATEEALSVRMAEEFEEGESQLDEDALAALEETDDFKFELDLGDDGVTTAVQAEAAAYVDRQIESAGGLSNRMESPGLMGSEAPVTVESEPSLNGAEVGWKPTEAEVPIYRKPVSPTETDAIGFKVGERVRHPSYGEGVITKILPMDDNVILNITFDSVGKRLLDPALCKLTPANGPDPHDH